MFDECLVSYFQLKPPIISKLLTVWPKLTPLDEKKLVKVFKTNTGITKAQNQLELEDGGSL